jgi:hypothetical protein
MQLKPKNLTIPLDNPFGEDKLSRSLSANVLTQLVATIREPFVLAIDSPWGTGKTTFIKMWMAWLKEKHGFPCICFNAWDSDFTGDPLVSFIGEMKASLDQSLKNAGVSTAMEEYVSKGKKLLGALARKSAPLAIKILTQGLLDLEKFDLGKLKESGIDDWAESLAKEKLEQYEADKNTILEFKAQLKEFVGHLSKHESTQNKPLIFFIDELDRCRPTYAIDLLEKVKHLFNVEGIIFVLAIDKVQIGHSIRSIYGSGMDVDGYLRRFIDLDYRLPDSPRDEFYASLYDRFNLLELSKNRNDGAEVLRDFAGAFLMLSDVFQLSLRTAEQCFAQFNIVIRTTPPRVHLFPSLLAFLLSLKAKDFSLYSSFSKGTPDMERVISLITGLSGGQKYWDSYYGLELEALYALSNGPPFDYSTGAKPHKDALDKYGADSPQGKRARQILELINHLRNVNAYNGLRHVIRRIELTEQFSLP